MRPGRRWRSRSLKVLQVVPYISHEASGPSYSVPALCQALVKAGVEVELHVLKGQPPPGAEYRCVTHGEWSWPRRLHISPALRCALIEAASRVDVVHSHGLWTMANVYPGWVVPGKRSLLVASPRGTLSAWALGRGQWRKQLMWRLAQARTLVRSACLHATADAEVADLRRMNLRGPVALIPNGIDIPPEDQADGERPRARRLLFLGRIHPVKGVDVLLRAWRQIQDELPDWEVQIVGPGEAGYPEEIRRLGRELGVERVSFPGPAYGEAKSAAYRQADLFVLPSHTENFGVAVAEALAHGVPAIVSRNAPWSGLEAHGCGWWIEHGEAPLVESLRLALSLPPADLRRRGRKGRQWMERDFSWSHIGEKMRDTYRWLLTGGAAPSWVRTA